MSIQKRGVVLGFSIEQLTGGPMRATERVPKSPEWLARRAEFVKQWEEMCSLGEREGFLAWVGYEGGYEPTEGTYDVRFVPDPE